MPKLWNHSSSSVSAAVSSTPMSSGMWNSRFSAMAAPSTSARSQAAMAISHSTHSAMVTRPRIGFAAGLRQVAAGDDAQARAQRLQQDGHGVRHHQHPEQAVAEARAAFQVGGPIAGVHVADADQVGRSGEGEHAPPEGELRSADAGVDIGERTR